MFSRAVYNGLVAAGETSDQTNARLPAQAVRENPGERSLTDLWQPIERSMVAAEFEQLAFCAKGLIFELADPLGFNLGADDRAADEFVAANIRAHIQAQVQILHRSGDLREITPQTATMLLAGIQRYVWEHKKAVTKAVRKEHMESGAGIMWFIENPALRNIDRMVYTIRTLGGLANNEQARELLNRWIGLAQGYNISRQRARQREVAWGL